jgi:membrane associated rhomboid family serine protease
MAEADNSSREYSPRDHSPRGKEAVALAHVGDISPKPTSVPPLYFDSQPYDNRPVRTRRSYFCMLVCVVCSLVFLAEIGRNGWGFQPFACPASCGGRPCYEDGSSCESNPMLGPTAHVMKVMGAKDNTGIFERGEWWRIIACNWLHVGLFHLLFNMLAVISLGFPLERRFGWWRVARCGYEPPLLCLSQPLSLFTCTLATPPLYRPYLFNMLAVTSLGFPLERRFGWWRVARCA